jgi:hypothetical protein
MSSKAGGKYMKKRLILIAAAICTISIQLLAQQVYVDYNHGLNFSQFHTYAWGQQPNPNQINDSIVMQNVQSNINSQLQSKGLQMVQESQNPDLIVVTSDGMKTETSYSAWGTGRGFGGGMGEISPEQSQVGTLIVNVYDAKNKQLAWRGIAKDTLSSKSEKNEEMITKAIDKMFKKYP